MPVAPSIVADAAHEVYPVLDDFGGNFGRIWRETAEADAQRDAPRPPRRSVCKSGSHCGLQHRSGVVARCNPQNRPRACGAVRRPGARARLHRGGPALGACLPLSGLLRLGRDDQRTRQFVGGEPVSPRGNADAAELVDARDLKICSRYLGTSERLQPPFYRLISLIFFGFPKPMYHSLCRKTYPRIPVDRARGIFDATHDIVHDDDTLCRQHRRRRHAEVLASKAARRRFDPLMLRSA
jgi:hypothetical protein